MHVSGVSCSCAKRRTNTDDCAFCCAATSARRVPAVYLSLAVPFSELKLTAGDRLDPCSDLPDVGAFFCISPFPPDGVPLLLWRAENETLRLRTCPFFNRDTGLNPNTAVAWDLLHTNQLGVVLVYCRHLVWEFLRSGVWGVAASNRTENKWHWGPGSYLIREG